jgi:hypothetical protein
MTFRSKQMQEQVCSSKHSRAAGCKCMWPGGCRRAAESLGIGGDKQLQAPLRPTGIALLGVLFVQACHLWDDQRLDLETIHSIARLLG